jgi:glycosyltransferase involved in cell wall biosynthesis
MLKNTPPLVSNIMIFLNAEKFIHEAIESVFAQTYQNWELLLVDDGSTDQSTAIALQYAQQYPGKVRYLEHTHHQNRGTGASRNLGLNHAQGNYITFLDADDVWLPHKLEQQVIILETHPDAAMVYGQMLLWYSWTGNSQTGQQDYFAGLGVSANTLIQPPQLLTNALTKHYQQPGTSNVMIRVAAIKQFGHFEESFRGWGEDRTFFAKLQLNVPIFVSDEIWIKYRQHPESCCHMTNSDKERALAIFQNFLDWLEQYLHDQDVENVEVWQALQIARNKLDQRRSALYSLWASCLSSSLLIGRRALPANFRHWLWVHVGLKLYRLVG